MTYQPKVYKKSGGDELVVASGGKITIESGGELELADGATLDVGDGLSEPSDITLADGKIIVGDGDGLGAAVTPSGDVTITNAGVTAIGAGKVTSAMLENGAGLAALVAAGLGASDAYDNTTDGAQELVAANSALDGDRAVMIIVTVDEAFVTDEANTQTVFTIGQTGAATKFMANTVLVDATAGSVFVAAGILTEETALLVTGTPASGTGTGGVSVTVLLLPVAV